MIFFINIMFNLFLLLIFIMSAKKFLSKSSNPETENITYLNSLFRKKFFLLNLFSLILCI